MVCEAFVKQLRRTMCNSPDKESLSHRSRQRLIAALDFGAKGESPDQTTARDACECATFCIPPIKDADDSQIAKFLKNVIKNPIAGIINQVANKDLMKEQYREEKVREAMAKCVVDKPIPPALVPAKKPEDAFLGDGERKPAWKIKSDTPVEEGTCLPKPKDVANSKSAPSGKLEGIFINRISYMGHCGSLVVAPGSKQVCFSSDYMSHGEPSETAIAFSPQDDPKTPTLVISDESPRAEIEAVRQKSTQSEYADGKIRFKKWGAAPSIRDWWHRGVVYGELVKSQDELPKIILVQSGTPKESFWKNAKNWVKEKLKMSGPRKDDPRMVLEMEDRDGGDMCMWLYHICCAMGGELKRDLGSRHLAQKDEMCPAGTICCPKTDVKDNGHYAGKRRPVPWHEDTISLLRVLAHGRLKHTPQFGLDDPLQGWKDRDPISSTGPSQCVDKATFHAIYPHGQGSVKSRTLARQNSKRLKDAKEATKVQCEYQCLMKKNWMGQTKKCYDEDGRPFVHMSKAVEKGECDYTMSSSPAAKKAKAACEAAKKGCGYKVSVEKRHPFINGEYQEIIGSTKHFTEESTQKSA
jgi:hypothetical protein